MKCQFVCRIRCIILMMNTIGRQADHILSNIDINPILYNNNTNLISYYMNINLIIPNKDPKYYFSTIYRIYL